MFIYFKPADEISLRVLSPVLSSIGVAPSQLVVTHSLLAANPARGASRDGRCRITSEVRDYGKYGLGTNGVLLSTGIRYQDNMN